ncbi:uncharacterized protein MYCGRDRAFT_97579 [Zymoseptoria tritici IPO323]|uniref:Uncharacterized protein n=1 Tax=Zymoseptoria tritici (strain CBS 115943 / IPO323) TaxID=336722 RepID=F9XQP3_ZYMTI|nr:uncharacterized protein MYCGRDRAFT_97579 [Zymoseptoria tritici IPO323]EGP82451.1 hypothetical protein MYCGRDRAFT_97579 [Zymoseptoria tritici IPO323]
MLSVMLHSTKSHNCLTPAAATMAGSELVLFEPSVYCLATTRKGAQCKNLVKEIDRISATRLIHNSYGGFENNALDDDVQPGIIFGDGSRNSWENAADFRVYVFDGSEAPFCRGIFEIRTQWLGK